MKKFFSFLIVPLFFFTGCVTDKEFATLSKRVELIETEYQMLDNKMASVSSTIETFEKKVETREKNLRTGYANLIAEKISLKNNILELNGQTEKIFYEFDNFSRKLESIEKKLVLLEERTLGVEDYLDFDKKENKSKNGQEIKNNLEAEKKSEQDSFILEEAGEEEVYEQAKKEFDLENFDKAMKLFVFHVKKFPKSSMADNSLFWLGEIYYKNKDYKRAIIEYQNVIEKYPLGNKVPAAYLKQGLAFYNIDRKDNAKIIFENLISKYPLSNEALIAKKKLKNF